MLRLTAVREDRLRVSTSPHVGSWKQPTLASAAQARIQQVMQVEYGAVVQGKAWTRQPETSSTSEASIISSTCLSTQKYCTQSGILRTRSRACR
jgi:hypothetical protein